jgi:hypothetical protein
VIFLHRRRRRGGVQDELSSSTTETATSEAASVSWSGSRRATTRVNREQSQDGRVVGGDVSPRHRMPPAPARRRRRRGPRDRWRRKDLGRWFGVLGTTVPRWQRQVLGDRWRSKHPMRWFLWRLEWAGTVLGQETLGRSSGGLNSVGWYWCG